MGEASGRAPSEPSSREPSPAVSAASGFDPLRWRADSFEGKPRYLPKKERQELDKLTQACRDYMAGLTPYRRATLAKAARSVSPINCGWQHYALAKVFIYELHSDSDQNPEGGDGTAPSSGNRQGDSA